MIKLTIIFIFLLLSGCATFHFPKTNLLAEHVKTVNIGDTHNDLVEEIGMPREFYIIYKNGKRKKYVEGVSTSNIKYFDLVYSYDSLENNMFYCNDYLIRLEVKGESSSVIKKEKNNKYTTTKVLQERCNRWAAQSKEIQRSNSNNWQSGLAGFNAGYNTTAPKKNAGKTCYSKYDCDSSQKCAKKENEYEGICIDVYYYEQ